ncbi:MAG: hypothetical protein BroJett014_23010 [Planctomycetota bacterium]|nr:MAG: hypothetical protein BroJett014_23010 [Planctomycetota bacterium]
MTNAWSGAGSTGSHQTFLKLWSQDMKKFALLAVLVAFGATFVLGCPAKNTASNTPSNTAPATNEAPTNK